MDTLRKALAALDNDVVLRIRRDGQLVDVWTNGITTPAQDAAVAELRAELNRRGEYTCGPWVTLAEVRQPVPTEASVTALPAAWRAR